jgi:cobalt-zinc-cadmium efflux system protein
MGFVIVETIYGLHANSLALLADAGHNFIDVISLVLAWLAYWLMRRNPTKRHTYGLGRTTILASLMNAITLAMAAGAIAWESVQRLMHPEPVAAHTVLGVAMIGIVINLGTAVMFMSGRKTDLNIKAAFVHMLADAGITLGVIVGTLLIMVTDLLWIDPAISLGIVLIIGITTWGMLKDSFNLAIDAIPDHVDRDAVETYLRQLPGVVDIHDLHIWSLSTTSTALTVHLVRPNANVDDGLLHQINSDLNTRFNINHVTAQIEYGDAADCPLFPQNVV